ncbi:hypothetical protein OOG41_26725 [Bacillus sp. AS_5]|uniref:hypothetical protein n=1 Tax=unclassified Bacillus (in: firmicutes) TaxID=185979 RepID=UPI00224A91CE|nr:hypothetical protein [Bacillus sp. AS_3]MCW4657014.1 hypothetical protein [Bacillus sp. AS_3]MCX2704678.1 hypothetical protein [Bacillus sp. AS_5]
MEKQITNIEEYKLNFTRMFVGDFKTVFVEEARKLVDLMLPIHDRMAAVEFLTDQYIKQVGKPPADVRLRNDKNKMIGVLEYLADHILYESLEGDTRVDKMTLEEYPVMTDNQAKNRIISRGEITVDVQLACRTVGADDMNYRKPTRRILRPYEEDSVNKRKDAKLASENEAYRKATQSSKITRSKVAA